MLAAIAEFERGLLLESQREGVAKAKKDGKYKGRQPTARAKGIVTVAVSGGQTGCASRPKPASPRVPANCSPRVNVLPSTCAAACEAGTR